MDFHNKVVLITGAGSGIGEQLTYRLLNEGAYVVLAGRRKERLDAVIAQSSRPGNAMAVPTDVSRYSDLENLIQATLAKHHRIDVLVNNAGVSISGAVDEVRPPDVEYLAKVNFLAPIFLTQLALPELKKQPSSMVVNVASMASLVAAPYQSFYCGVKHGLRGFSEAMRREFIGTSVRVLTVYPGTVSSEMINENVKKKMQEVGFNRISGLMPTEQLAELLLDAMKKEKSNVLLAGREKMLARLERFAPSVLDRVLHKLSPKIREILKEVNKWTQERTKLKASE